MCSAQNQSPEPQISDLLARAYRFRILGTCFAYPGLGDGARIHQALEAAVTPQILAVLPSGSSVVEVWAAADDETLRAEYTRLFMGRTACSLHSATYAGSTQLAGPGPLLADISGFYQAFGLDTSDEDAERPDHLAVQLGFYGILLVKEAYAISEGWDEHAEVTHEAVVRFLTDHLGGWQGVLLPLLREQNAASPYPETAAWLDEALADECARLNVDPTPFKCPLEDPLQADEFICPHGTGGSARAPAEQPVHFQHREGAQH
nr:MULTISPECIES: molecular chaperone TorD family protein [unclassified Thioalkalivibrio]